ncbi:MAG: helix-turn-helix transcriptional regulator [Acidobacteria bacterium]|nr:helix-turn-helix transcriptional regulator [Acidobacteriota bacterium]
MEKSLHSEGYTLFLRQLRDVRKRNGITQTELAERINETQSFVSKCERGERRLDIVEVWTFSKALGIPFKEFAANLDANMTRKAHSGRSKHG